MALNLGSWEGLFKKRIGQEEATGLFSGTVRDLEVQRSLKVIGENPGAAYRTYSIFNTSLGETSLFDIKQYGTEFHNNMHKFGSSNNFWLWSANAYDDGTDSSFILLNNPTAYQTGIILGHWDGEIGYYGDYYQISTENGGGLTIGGDINYAYYLDKLQVNLGSIETTGFFKSTKATGTAPFQCTSTTLNTNLNADLCDGQHLSTTSSPTFANITANVTDQGTVFEVADAGTTTAPVALILRHATSGTADVGFGIGYLMQLEDDGGTFRNAANIATRWINDAAASYQSKTRITCLSNTDAVGGIELFGTDTINTSNVALNHNSTSVNFQSMLNGVYLGDATAPTGNPSSGCFIYSESGVLKSRASGGAITNLGSGGGMYVDRGDPSAYDFELASLTTDGSPHDLDLSSIVPAGAKSVLLRVRVQDGATNSYILFRKNGNSNLFNTATVRTQAAGVYNDASLIVSCDTSRVIEYQASNTTFDAITITVAGWFI